MAKPPKSLIFGFVLALMFVPPLHTQTTTNVPADSDATAVKKTPTSQAPDDVTNKIADLVHAGKYAEAQQLTAGLLLAYPDDQRLARGEDDFVVVKITKQTRNQIRCRLRSALEFLLELRQSFLTQSIQNLDT